MPVVRNPQFYFREGYCWNLINGTRSTNELKFRIAPKGVNDVGGMTLHNYSEALSTEIIIAIGNSNFASRYTETFVNHTVNFQVNDCRQIPIIIPTKEQMKDCKILFNKAISLKKSVANGIATDLDIQKELTEVETELDNFVNNLYGI